MDNQVSNDEINSWIDDLVSKLGIKESAPCNKYSVLLKRGKFDACIQAIAAYLGLPVRIDLTVIDKQSRAHTTGGFTSKGLVRTNSSGHGTYGITAQVSIPSWLPPYGSMEIRDYPIRIKVSEDCQDEANSFITIMAHELSHIVLASLRHPEKDNEFCTDLTAMVLGFSAVTKRGRHVVKTWSEWNQQITQTTKYGYLSDGQFTFAYNKIVGLLEDHVRRKKEILRQIKSLKKILTRFRKLLRSFTEFSTCLDKNPSQRINAKDGLRIVQFHQPGYADKYAKLLNSSEKFLESAQPISDIIHHTKTTVGFMKETAAELERVKITFGSLSKELAGDVRVLKRNAPLLYRLKRILIWQLSEESPPHT